MPEVNRGISLPIIYPFLPGGGKMGELVRTKNWSHNSIGEPAKWPQSLRTTLNIVLNTPLPMILYWGPELHCFYNDPCSQCLDVKRQHSAILGLPAENLLHEEWPVDKSLLDQVMATGNTASMEDLLIPVYKNGKTADTFWSISYSAVKDESEKTGGVLVMCCETTEKMAGLKRAGNKKQPYKNGINGDDHYQPKPGTISETINEITAQKNFIHSLSESEKKFRNTVMQAPVGITVLRGPNFIVEMANATYLQVIDKTEEEFVGKALYDVLPEQKKSIESLLVDVLATGITYNTTEFAVPLNRFGTMQMAYFSFSYQALKDDYGNISGIIVIASEVTSMVKAKYSLAESEKHFRNMIMQSPIPMTILRGKEYVIEIANIAMIKNIWRREEESVLGKRMLDVFPELKEQKYPEQLTRVYTTGKAVRENEAVAYVKGVDGTKKFYLDYEYAPLFETDGSVSGIMVTANNVTEIVETRQRLELEEARLRLATEGTRLATWDLDLQTRDIIYSARLAEIFGFASSAVILHRELRDRIHPEDIGIVEKAFEEAIQTSIYHYEVRIVWPDKTIHWIRTQGKVIYNDTNLPLRLLGTTVDITESKASEEEIARLAAIVLSSKDSIISENMEGIITSWNEAAERMFGYEASEIIGMPVATLIPDDRIGEETEILEQIERDLSVYSFETQRVKKDKTILDISLTISPVKDPRGKIVGASKIARDITKQKEIEIKIIESEQRFRLLANCMAQMIWTGDSAGNLNYYNQAVYDYSGMNFEQLQNDGWLQMVHPDDQKENINKWQHSIASGKDFIFEHRFKRYDGEFRWQLSRALPQKDSNGNIQMWVGTSTDIHDIKENEQQKDFFISMASHELKTPVTSIKGYVQILMSLYKHKGDEFLKNSLETVNKQIITLTLLITDLLDLSKIKAGSLQLNKERFNINELIIEIVKEIQHTQPDCIIDFTDQVNANVFVDRGRIGQVLINILTNAIKYSPNCKEIQVSSKITNNELLVSISDSGIGISRTDQQKIFQRFYRVAGKDEKTFPGFGIGLFIASQIIQRHNGKIGVDSEPGKGSVFYFTLPLNSKNYN